MQLGSFCQITDILTFGREKRSKSSDRRLKSMGRSLGGIGAGGAGGQLQQQQHRRSTLRHSTDFMSKVLSS